jgi:hypothetical protein
VGARKDGASIECHAEVIKAVFPEGLPPGVWATELLELLPATL